jgi:hypothetical protein
MVQVTISVGGSTFAHDFPEVPTVGSVVPIQRPGQSSPVGMTVKKVIVECDLPPGSNTGFHDFYRKEAEEAMRGPAPVSGSSVDGHQPDEVDLIVPPGVGSASGLSGREYIPDGSGIIRVLRDDAPALKRAGFLEVPAAE